MEQILIFSELSLTSKPKKCVAHNFLIELVVLIINQLKLVDWDEVIIMQDNMSSGRLERKWGTSINIWVAIERLEKQTHL